MQLSAYVFGSWRNYSNSQLSVVCATGFVPAVVVGGASSPRLVEGRDVIGVLRGLMWHSAGVQALWPSQCLALVFKIQEYFIISKREIDNTNTDKKAL